MRTQRRGMVLLGTAAAALMLAASAGAAGPKPVGGEDVVTYKGTGFELRALPNGRVAWLKVDTLWNCPTLKRVKPFLADGKPLIDRTRRVRASDKYDGGHWTLRFTADWSQVSGSFSARASNGCRTKKLHLAGKRVRPANTWQFGRYTGTTSQGLPIEFTVGWAVRYGSIQHFVKTSNVTVRFNCDGVVSERALHTSREGPLNLDGHLLSSPTENGQLSAPGGMAEGQFEGHLSGTKATGDVMAYINGETACELDTGVTFTAARTGS